MKKLFYLLLFFSINIPVFAHVNGAVEVIDGKKVLFVWGTHEERGYAHGYLMAAEIKSVFDDYVINYLCQSNAYYYNYARGFFITNFAIEDKYQTEADAMIQGMIDAGVNLYNQTLGRDIDATDMLICSALPDLYQMLFAMPKERFCCSSISSWGTSTLQDPTLSGHLVITRLMDWDYDESICEHHLLIVNIPSGKGEQKWVSMAFAGFLGALSIINESGVGAFLNLGNQNVYQAGDPFYPILFTVRNGIETDDYNQDSENSPADVVQAIQDRNRSGGSIIHVVKDEGVDSAPVIIECNNENGVVARDMSNNTSVAGENLVATNHFRSLYLPVPCDRYAGIVNALNTSTDISPERSWDILKNAACLPNNLHAIQYIAYCNVLKWATTEATPAYSQDPTLFDLDELFNYQTGIEEYAMNDQYPKSFLLQNYPNPFNPTTTIAFYITRSEFVSLTIYNTIGKKITTLISQKLDRGIHRYNWNATGLPGGVYFYRIQTSSLNQTRKLILLK